MTGHLLPFIFTVLVWWASTGAILWLVRRPAWTHKWTFAGMTLVAAAAAGGLWASSARQSAASAYCAFTCVLLLWAWQETAFLLGYITGPRRQPASRALRGWPRAREAFTTISHHELALLGLMVVVLLATYGQPEPTGAWTFAVLWLMRQSAKLNLFLGVRNLYEGFLPTHLAYLGSYFRQAPANALFPVSVIASTVVAGAVWLAATSAPTQASMVSLSLVGSLLALAVLEHWFLVLPLPSENLWKWAVRR